MKESLEQHLAATHLKPVTNSVITESLDKILKFTPQWCEIKIIDSKEYCMIPKEIELYQSAKKMINQKYVSLQESVCY